MKHVIIGTAGHVDHGKTALIQALTGTNTDRLPEEKRRGVTIELGFAYLTLDEEIEADIIDVPGHERFIRNMLTGAGQVDIALMVVAADEGPMPQTIEHLELLQLLGVTRGVVAVTRCDLADVATLAKTRAQLTERFRGSFLEPSPVVEVCAITGTGLAALRAALGHEALLVPPKDAQAPLHLPVDRSFTVPGFGTVATGVLMRGMLHVGDTVSVQPGHKTARVRGLQCHGRPVESVGPGRRAAVNLAGITKAELGRGCVLGPQDAIENETILCVKLFCMPSTEHAILHASRLHLYTGSGETVCRVLLWNKKELRPGEECFAQLFPEEPLAVTQGDRFAVRFYSPVCTVGGGVVLETAGRRYRAKDAAWQRLLALWRGEQLPAALEAPARCGAEAAVEEDIQKRKTQDEQWKNCLIKLLKGRGYLPLGLEEAAAVAELVPRNCTRLLELLVGERRAKKLGDAGWLAQEHWEAAMSALMEALRQEPFTLAQYRDLLNTSRKPCQALLEYFDSVGATARTGEARVRGARYNAMIL